MRVGVCGTGYWAALVHLPGFAGHCRTELAGVCGRNARRTAELAERFDTVPFADLDAMLAAVDVVSFVVPPDVQGTLAAKAARAGKHLMLEKPLAATLRDAAALHAVMRGQHVVALCFLTRMFVPAVDAFVREARQLEATSGKAVFRSGALLAGSPYHGSAWRQQEYGALWDAAPHSLSVLVMSCGPIARVAATLPGRGHVRLSLDHETGGSSSIEVDLCDSTTRLSETYEVRAGQKTLALSGFSFDRSDAFRSAIDELIGRIDAGADMEGDHLSLPMHLMAVLDAAEASLRSGGDCVVVRPEWSAPVARYAR
jgi:predicted dehydrogenase